MGILDNIRYGIGHAVSYVHKDTGEFLKAAADPTYVEDVYRRPIDRMSSSQRESHKREANRVNESVVNHIAPNVETARVTAVKTAATAGAAAATLATAGAAAPMLGLTGSGAAFTAAGAATVGSMGLAGGQFAEAVMDSKLNEGEAPVRSLRRIYAPVDEDAKLGVIGNFAVDELGIRNDRHYAAGGTPDNHPQSAYNPDNRPQYIPPAPTFGQQVVGYFKAMGEKTGLSFGVGSLIGAGIGAALMFASPLIGGIVLAAGLLLGQTALDYMTAPKTPEPVQPPAAPTPNIARSDAPDPSPVVSPQAGLPTKSPQTREMGAP